MAGNWRWLSWWRGVAFYSHARLKVAVLKICTAKGLGVPISGNCFGTPFLWYIFWYRLWYAFVAVSFCGNPFCGPHQPDWLISSTLLSHGTS
jgi:hypothetical protein